MGIVRHLGSLAELRSALKRDLKGLSKKSRKAIEKTADVGRLVAYGKAPVAFGALRDSLSSQATVTGARIRASAPHAQALEVGSRPHMPPLQPLVAWVKLRGMQGLNAAASGGRARGQPAFVAQEIRARGTGTSTPIAAPEDIAWMIARAIAKNGTRPHWFMRRSLPEVRSILDAYMKSFLREGPA